MLFQSTAGILQATAVAMRIEYRLQVCRCRPAEDAIVSIRAPAALPRRCIRAQLSRSNHQPR